MAMPAAGSVFDFFKVNMADTHIAFSKRCARPGRRREGLLFFYSIQISDFQCG
jgi:hypothetical protein